MVIEACEYRNAFLGYHPDIAVITNIDPDHLDFFKTNDAYYASFQKFMSGSRCVVMPRDEYLTFEKNGYALTEGGSLSQNTSTLILVDATHFEVLGNGF